MTQEVLKLSQEALAGLKDVEKQVRELVAENKALKEALAQTQEPDYWLGFGLQAHTEKPFENATPLYTTPPQRTWVGLADEEVRKICVNEWGGYEQCRAIEAKLKEKNT